MSKNTEEHKSLTPREQVLHRKGMWVGSSVPTNVNTAILDGEQLVAKDLEIIPSLVKITEEIIANSCDEHIRTKENKKLRGWLLDEIVVTLTSEGVFSVRDNGGITNALHSSGVKTPQLIFGSLFSSGNYNDNEERKVVGTNGVGSALTNIFSTEFDVITADGKNQCHLKWKDNMSTVEEISTIKSKLHYTQILAQIDLSQFDVEEVSWGTIKYIERLCILSAAANPGLSITFNDETFKFDSFKQYVEMYGYTEMIGEKNAHWEYWICPVPAGQGDRHYGLVNGVGCDGGTIDKMINGWIWEGLREHLKSNSFKKEHGSIIEPTPGAMSQRYVVFTNAQVVNPEYDSQSKERLTTDVTIRDKAGKKRWRKFNSKGQLAESSIVDSLIDWYTQKVNAEEAGAVRKKARELKNKTPKSIRKLVDATGKTKAQRKGSQLWIFEGDSAGKSFRPTRSPKTQGAIFLRGKCKNSYAMSTLKLISNEEFQNIIVALGLDPTKPDNMKGLRYDEILICTDADRDGDSICGQLITMFAIHFPKTIELGMIRRAVTPLYVSQKGTQRKYFYSQPEFDKFKGQGWKARYIKGLGSLLKEHYRDMLKEPKVLEFVMDDQALARIGDWMGGSSANRKKHLSA